MTNNAFPYKETNLGDNNSNTSGWGSKLKFIPMAIGIIIIILQIILLVKGYKTNSQSSPDNTPDNSLEKNVETLMQMQKINLGN